MKNPFFLLLLMLPASIFVTVAHADMDWMQPYDVTWTTPSADAAGSMPLGNGEVGINLWVADDGSVNFYISRSDSFSEISRLLKVGYVKVSLSSNPFTTDNHFKQQLHLHDGVCKITAGDGPSKITLQIFVDANRPVVHCIGSSASPITVKATVESWRTQPRELPNAELGSAWTMNKGATFPLIESADVFPPANDNSAMWYHRNQTSVVPATLQTQSLESVPVSDPLLHRTFGGMLTGAGFKKVDDRGIEAASPMTSFSLRVACPCGQFQTADEWVARAAKAAGDSVDSSKAMGDTIAWWHQFWNRSWVNTNAGREKMGDEVSPITRGYNLQRYVQACGGRGTIPIKFNGGIFTVEPKRMGKPFNPDYRSWGDCFWWQNTRHMYHPMMASGDVNMTDPLFNLYSNARPLCEARAKIYHQCEGCYFPETMTIWGTYANGDYGWNRKGHKPQDVLCPYWQYAWNQGPELVGLLLDRWDYTSDPQFLNEQVLPMAESVLKYFDTRFKKDADGKIVLDPTQSVETFWYGVINDMPSVAGLNDITTRLCNLPNHLVAPEQRVFFAKMKSATPAIPVHEVGYKGATVKELAPAERYSPQTSNCENPQLYAVWPFRLFGIGKPGLDEAVTAYVTRKNHLDVGWGYDGNCAALLGLTDEAARILQKKCANTHPGYRWPATWGPNFDWLPDQNHGGNLLETTQLMLLQCDGEKIRLLPSWPKKWDVSFKLHATHQTVVECDYRDGRIEKLEVTPKERAEDIVMP